MKDIVIGDKVIGDGHPSFIIAEMSANHLQDFDRAVSIIKAAKEAGADAIKLQTYTPDTMTIDCDSKYFRIDQDTIWDGKTFYELYDEAYTPWEWHEPLKEVADELGLIFFSTPFDKTSADFLDEIGVPAFKIASFEAVDIPLIEYVASKGKPVIISTGITNLCEIEEAVEACRTVGNDNIILLKCTSSYPASLDEMNLATIPHMRDTFEVIAGLSDHTLSTAAPVSATILGAKVIEKHIILSRCDGGPDAGFSLEPTEFKEMIDLVRESEQVVGKLSYKLSEKAIKNKEMSRSLFIVENVKAGDLVTENNVRSIRPGYGLPPKYLDFLLGKKYKNDLSQGTPAKLEFFE